MDLRIIGKLYLYIFEGTSSIFYKDSEALSTWIWGTYKDHWCNIRQSLKCAAEVKMMRKS